MNYKDLTDQLVKKSLKLGADAAEVYLQTSRNLSINVHNQDLETIQEAASKGVGLRVIVDGKIGFSHTNDLSDRALEDTM
ncbi:MAG: DNA gyrase modulator, partial [Bacteroidales bacterium]